MNRKGAGLALTGKRNVWDQRDLRIEGSRMSEIKYTKKIKRGSEQKIGLSELTSDQPFSLGWRRNYEDKSL